MPRIKYVGVKPDGETAFAKDCKRDAWLPGDSTEVTDTNLVARMLKHPDVFALDEDKPGLDLIGLTASKINPANVTAGTSITSTAAATAQANDQQAKLAQAQAADKLTLTQTNGTGPVGTPGAIGLSDTGLAGKLDPAATTLAPGGTVGQPKIEVTPEFVIKTPDGFKVLDGIDLQGLRIVAADLGVTHHRSAGLKTVREKLLDAFPVEAK